MEEEKEIEKTSECLARFEELIKTLIYPDLICS